MFCWCRLINMVPSPGSVKVYENWAVCNKCVIRKVWRRRLQMRRGEVEMTQDCKHSGKKLHSARLEMADEGRYWGWWLMIAYMKMQNCRQCGRYKGWLWCEHSSSAERWHSARSDLVDKHTDSCGDRWNNIQNPTIQRRTQNNRILHYFSFYHTALFNAAV